MNDNSTKIVKLVERQNGLQVIAMAYDQQIVTLHYVEIEYPKRLYSYDFFNQTTTFFDQNVEEFKEITIDLLTSNIYFISNSEFFMGFIDLKSLFLHNVFNLKISLSF